MVEDRFEFVKGAPNREPGAAIEGDHILIYCRKPKRWQSIRGSNSHNYFKTDARMNALAVLMRKFKNLQK